VAVLGWEGEEKLLSQLRESRLSCVKFLATGILRLCSTFLGSGVATEMLSRALRLRPAAIIMLPEIGVARPAGPVCALTQAGVSGGEEHVEPEMP